MTFAWDQANIDTLRRLWTGGMSAREIVIEFGGQVTRAAVLGKISRMGLQRTADWILEARAAERAARRHPQSLGAAAVAVKPRPNQAKPLPIRRTPFKFGTPPAAAERKPPTRPVDQLADEIPQAQRKSILSLAECDCRWPYGSPGQAGFFFCGATAEPGRPYCAAHCRVAYVRVAA